MSLTLPLASGDHVIDPPVVLAPMAGITNSAFRALCREQGAGLFVSEMVTDRYLTVHHHSTVEEFKEWCDKENLPIIGIDNLPISKQLESATLPKRCVMLFGQEGAGMSDEGVAVCSVVLAISQYGSTRSMNASAAGAIAMYAWAMQHLNPSNHPKN